MGERKGAGEGCAEERTGVCSWWTRERMVQRSEADALSGNGRRRDYSIWEIAVTCYTSQPGVHLHNLAQSSQDPLRFPLKAAQQLFARRYVCRGSVSGQSNLLATRHPPSINPMAIDADQIP